MEIILLVLLGGLLLFFMISSRRRQKAQQENIEKNLRPGATVMTSFGVFGTVKDVDDDGIKVTIESGEGTNLVVHRQAIAQIHAPEVPEAEATDEKSDEPIADNAPRITDAELDAMNEAKRKSEENDNDSDKK